MIANKEVSPNGLLWLYNSDMVAVNFKSLEAHKRYVVAALNIPVLFFE